MTKPNGWYFADGIYLIRNYLILIPISLQFVPNSQIDDMITGSGLVLSGIKSLPEPKFIQDLWYLMASNELRLQDGSQLEMLSVALCLSAI